MGETSIEWASYTFNPWRGCTKVSPGCAHCYAEVLSKRNPAVLGKWGPSGTRVVAAESYWRQPLKWDREARQAGERRRVFCASLADVLEDWPDLVEPRARLFGLIEATPHLDWLLLTKRPENWSNLLHQLVRETHDGADMWASSWLDGDAPSNVWLGASVEDQARADERIPHLLRTPATVRFLSVEPLLGPINLRALNTGGRISKYDCLTGRHGFPGDLPEQYEGALGTIDWVIVGGESGHGSRPCDLAWIRSLVDQCRAAGVSCFLKQLGSNPVWGPPYEGFGAPVAGEVCGGFRAVRDKKGSDPSEWPEDLCVREFPRSGLEATSGN